MTLPLSPNFAHLQDVDPAVAKLGNLAERLLPVDANTSILKVRQYAELLSQVVAARSGVWQADETQHERLARLRREGLLNDQVFRLFTTLRREGNRANHEITGTEEEARFLLRLAWQLGIWLYYTVTSQEFSTALTPDYVEPGAAGSALDLPLLEREEQVAEQATVTQLQAAEQQAAPKPAVIKAAQKAAQLVNLTEKDTRKLIDQALRDVGWEVDTKTLTYASGARPEKGRNRAIAEWPAAERTRADYVLFVGLTPVAVIEAKRKNKNAYSHLDQAERYSKFILQLEGLTLPGGPWGEYQIPFLFSTNGRPYLKQHEQFSGIWFRDARHSHNLPRVLVDWYSPEGLTKLLAHDPHAGQQSLDALPVQFAFPLRPYQRAAIQAVEAAMGRQQRQILVAMATGTGKTKTCIALIYRLLKTQRVRRVLFLVDRRSLGEQAAGAFKDTRMEGVQNFADIYNLAELGDVTPGPDTVVHVATVQSMVSRVFSPAEGQVPPAIDTYDCIVVDEAHRGYLLDREMSDTELTFRDGEDYLSKYRRVLEYFDATRIGLTATPALQTVQIFGKPVYTYAYREAVVDGYLVDHGPPERIKTELNTKGIHWDKGAAVDVFDQSTGAITTVYAPDELDFEVDAFNRQVITESFNRVVCAFLAQQLDPTSLEKTLIFCANDAHADLVVHLLKEEFAKVWGSVDNDAVAKITGTVDDPLRIIRRYKNERLPNVAVTVDLLTTGVDVPEIVNVVFLRRVRSRILYDQMLGRATRLCDRLQKTHFRIYDAVGIYDALKDITDMKPVVVDVNISFAQLIAEVQATQGEARQEALRQLTAKAQRRQRRMGEDERQDFETASGGLSVEDFLGLLREKSSEEIATWFTGHQGLTEILDQVRRGQAPPVLISNHADRFIGTETGYGDHARPEDYLDAFRAYVRDNPDAVAALTTVLTRPADLTRKDLRELELILRSRGFTPANLDTAWKAMTNQEMAGRLIGYIRQAALGEDLMPFEQRVDRALSTLLASRAWTKPQENWLRTLAKQTKANGLVDEAALDDPDFIFRREMGGSRRLDNLFGGELLKTLQQFNKAVWTA
ncbi:type I restriction-modification system deoxyribonuclease [Deinococcus humi]|nr:type I restriction-modification system deoxyribonuclease [Deinococcus humi]